MKKHVLAFLSLSVAVTMALAGCSGSQNKPTEGTKAQTEEASGAAAEAGAAGAGAEEAGEMPDIWVKDETVEKRKDAEILVVSFGTSYNNSREITIGGIEDAIALANREYPVRRAFTSQIIIDKLKERDDLEIDNVEQGLERALANGVTTLVVQPTHIMSGYEYADLKEELEAYEDKFEKVALGTPLLTSDKDFEDVIAVITEETADYAADDTAIVFMGHGTESKANEVYAKLQEELQEKGFDNYFVGTVEAEPSIEDVMAAVKENGSIKKVVLEPLMIVCGDHANNDMAGDDDDSWKSRFEAEGYEVECILKGMGQMQGIRNIYAEHAKEALDSLK